jgi:hypothetical protein
MIFPPVCQQQVQTVAQNAPTSPLLHKRGLPYELPKRLEGHAYRGDLELLGRLIEQAGFHARLGIRHLDRLEASLSHAREIAVRDELDAI